MTSREKAIEVLKQYNLPFDLVSIKHRLQQSYSKLLVDYIKENEKESIGKYGIEFNSSFHDRWSEIKHADMFLLDNYPTIDDAIKVVEEEVDRLLHGIDRKSHIECHEATIILTALKGLKGE